MKKILKGILFGVLIFLLLFIGYLFLGGTEPAKDIIWGVNFSQKHAQNLGLNWRNSYLALFDDLGVKNIKIASYWDLIERNEGEYFFEDLDWQIKEAENRGAKILLVIGMKTPRWPECHIPNWAKNLSQEERQERILKLIKKVALQYRDSQSIEYWQVENEPFFSFGECPKISKKTLKEEIDLIKSLDEKSRPVIISDSGEFSFWINAAKLGNIVGITMYRKAWFKELHRYFNYPFPPVFYERKAKIIEKLFNKKVICVELQAEPWGPRLLYDSPILEQEKTMNLEQFRKNIEFAKKTGLKEFYLWGAEWWFWMKEVQNKPGIWNEARKLFNN